MTNGPLRVALKICAVFTHTMPSSCLRYN